MSNPNLHAFFQFDQSGFRAKTSARVKFFKYFLVTFFPNLFSCSFFREYFNFFIQKEINKDKKNKINGFKKRFGKNNLGKI